MKIFSIKCFVMLSIRTKDPNDNSDNENVFLLTVEKWFIVSDHLQSQQQAIKDLILENHCYHFVETVSVTELKGGQGPLLCRHLLKLDISV